MAGAGTHTPSSDQIENRDLSGFPPACESGFERFHSIMDSGIIKKISEMTPAERKVFERILDEIDVYADSFLNM